MKKFERLGEGAYRLVTAYKDIFTTVYLFCTEEGALLFDAASFPEDIEDAVLPMLSQVGIDRDALKYVFISHNHKDHAGGLEALAAAFPNTCILSRSEVLQKKYEGHPFRIPKEGDLFLNTFRVVEIPGHTADSAALLDVRSNTLVTGDCLQAFGIFGSEDWAANINLPAEHLAALKKLRGMEIDAILAAHDYHPVGYCAHGKEAVSRYIDACTEPLDLMKRLILENPALDDEGVRTLYNESGRIPTVRARVIGAVRQALC